MRLLHVQLYITWPRQPGLRGCEDPITNQEAMDLEPSILKTKDASMRQIKPVQSGQTGNHVPT
jgi:hypothetical protein